MTKKEKNGFLRYKVVSSGAGTFCIMYRTYWFPVWRYCSYPKETWFDFSRKMDFMTLRGAIQRIALIKEQGKFYYGE
jgi:hypothetical protein